MKEKMVMTKQNNFGGDDVKTIDSREVAEMLEKEHGNLLKDIQGSGKNLGIIPVLEKGNFHVSDYFIESSYKAGTREYKCYLVTKMGCEVLGNKQQGEKGILFTAKYVKKFNDMEQNLLQLSPKELLQLKILNGTEVERAGAMIEYEKVLTQPLIAENKHKGEVIVGLTEDITLAEKRQRISQIIRHGSKNYKDRYNLLYSEFNKKYHVDTATRLKNAIERKEVKKSMNRMGYICETMNKTAELYELACKLFENDVESLMQEMWNKIAS